MKTLIELSKDLAEGTCTSRDLTEQSLEAIAHPDGEGTHAFLKVYDTLARAQADAWDGKRKAGDPVPRFAGIPMALKDLFDVKGDVTTAGSTVLSEAEPAARDGVAVARLRDAGFVFVGRTNMVEFAFGGLGPNPHYGTPLSVYDRESGRAPGGSSSGSAVAVADGMAAIAMGTDTGGSCRVPAAFNGLTGYKPTASRISTEGVYPLSTTLDSIGPIGRSVQCCASVDSILAGDWPGELAPRTPGSLKLAVVKNFVLENLDDDVARIFESTLDLLSSSGVSLTDITVPAIDDIPAANAAGGIVPAEAWALHRSRLETDADCYDPRVRFRIMKGQKQTAADYIDALQARRRITAEAHVVTRPYDAVLMPSVAIIPPKLTEIESDTDYFRLNTLILRNTSIGNFLDRCVISLPASAPGTAPVGLMLMADHGADENLFAVAAAVEKILSERL